MMIGSNQKLLMARAGVSSRAFGLIETREDGDNLTTYTFPVSNYPAGVLVLSIHAKRLTTASNSISSVSVGGGTATEAVQISSGGVNTFVSGLYYISLASAFTGDIVITFGAEQLRAAIGSFYLPSGYAPDFTDSAIGSTSLSLSVGDASEGYYIAAVSANSDNTVSVTNLPEVYNFQMESNAFTEVWGGFDLESGSKTLEVSMSSTQPFMCAVAARFA